MATKAGDIYIEVTAEKAKLGRKEALPYICTRTI
jgi:hypothetical protein